MKYKNPLVLTMGHPVKDRLARLSRSPKFRAGGVLASLLVSGAILASTSFARTGSTPITKGAVAPIITSIIDGQEYKIQGQPFMLSYINVRRNKVTATAGAVKIGIYSSALGTKEQIVGHDPDAKEGWASFPPMHHSDRCVRHIAENNPLPFWYKETGAVVTGDDENDIYRMSCMPGTRAQIKAMSTDDFIAGLNASPDLSADERAQLMAFYQKGGPKAASVVLKVD